MNNSFIRIRSEIVIKRKPIGTEVTNRMTIRIIIQGFYSYSMDNSYGSIEALLFGHQSRQFIVSVVVVVGGASIVKNSLVRIESSVVVSELYLDQFLLKGSFYARHSIWADITYTNDINDFEAFDNRDLSDDL